MKFRYLVLAGTLAAIPLAAEEVQFEGHVLEVDASQEARAIVRMEGTRYRLPGTAAQIVDKAEKCITGQNGLALVAADPVAGTVAARGRADYRQMWSTRSIRANLQIEADDGYFRIVQSELAQAQGGSAESDDAAYAPISQAGDWESAVSAAITMETRLVDCLYR